MGSGPRVNAPQSRVPSLSFPAGGLSACRRWFRPPRRPVGAACSDLRLWSVLTLEGGDGGGEPGIKQLKHRRLPSERTQCG